MVLLISLLYLYNPFTVLEVLDKEVDLDKLYGIDVEVYVSNDEYINYNLSEDNEINSLLRTLNRIKIRRNLDRILYNSTGYPKFKNTYDIQLLDSNNKVISRIWIRDKRYISINKNSYSVYNPNVYDNIYEIILNEE